MDYEFEDKTNRLMILAVDDMPVILNTVKGILEEKYEVFSLTKAAQVEKFLETHSPDLFLLDIEMPVMDGYALLSLIREHEKHKDTPVIFLTSNATADYVKKAFYMGITDFIKKPFNKDVLLEKIQSCLNQNQTKEV